MESCNFAENISESAPMYGSFTGIWLALRSQVLFNLRNLGNTEAATPDLPNIAARAIKSGC